MVWHKCNSILWVIKINYELLLELISAKIGFYSINIKIYLKVKTLKSR